MSNWVKVAKANNLEKDDVVQVWSFRVDKKLCMAITVLRLFILWVKQILGSLR
ncbi:hypothetical protein HN51_022452, partial [Arachis hypogaea]